MKIDEISKVDRHCGPGTTGAAYHTAFSSRLCKILEKRRKGEKIPPHAWCDARPGPWRVLAAHIYTVTHELYPLIGAYENFRDAAKLLWDGLDELDELGGPDGYAAATPKLADDFGW